MVWGACYNKRSLKNETRKKIGKCKWDDGLKRRNKLGASEILISVFAVEDSTCGFNCLHMNEDMFNIL